MMSFKLGDAERKCYGRRHKHSLIEEFGEPPKRDLWNDSA